jgi:hypothetical protein
MIKVIQKTIDCANEDCEKLEKEFEDKGWNLLGTFKLDDNHSTLDFAKDIYVEENEFYIKIYFDCGEVIEKKLEESEINKLLLKDSNYINYWKVEKLVNNNYEIILEEEAPQGWENIGWDKAIKNIDRKIPVFN